LNDRRFQLFVVAIIIASFAFWIVAAFLSNAVALVVSAVAGAAVVLLGWPDASRRRNSSTEADLDEHSWLERSEFLCDGCKYDNDRDCSRPERPNARSCPDFRRRG
jgi:hypothetical protein